MKVRTIITLIAAGVFLLISCQNNIKTVKLNSQLDTISYCVGITIGTNLKKSPMEEINFLAVAKGLQDAYNNKKTFVNSYEATRKVNDYLYKLETLGYMKNLEEGNKFLEKNKARKDIITLPSGLQYRIIREGTGPVPKLTDSVTVHYHGKLLDGIVFDSSVNRGEPVTFPVYEVIRGWQEVLQLMPVGSKWEVFLPTGLAYGLNPPRDGIVKPNTALIFEIELLSIKKSGNQ